MSRGYIAAGRICGCGTANASTSCATGVGGGAYPSWGSPARGLALLAALYDTPVPVALFGRLVAIGLVAGVFSSFFGVGGGVVIVPLLLLLAAFRPHEATATSLGAIAITALAGVVAYALRHDVRYAYAVLVGLPATIGVLSGATLQQRLSGRSLTIGFAALLTGIGVWLIVG
jgi:hypothetical protein